MAKHKRWSEKPKESFEEEIDDKKQTKIVTPKTPTDFKSTLLSATKFVYIAAAAALLSGIFTPLTMECQKTLGETPESGLAVGY